MFTNRKEGAPPGWYKVVVIAAEPLNPDDPYTPGKSYIAVKYNAPQTTDLSLEVVASPKPGAYDLEMTNKSN
jgi:hypothetical protein